MLLIEHLFMLFACILVSTRLYLIFLPRCLGDKLCKKVLEVPTGYLYFVLNFSL